MTAVSSEVLAANDLVLMLCDASCECVAMNQGAQGFKASPAGLIQSC